MQQQLEASQTARDVELLLIEAGWIQAANKRNGEPAPFLQGSPKLFVINAIHGGTEYAIGGGEDQAHRTPMDAARYLIGMIQPKPAEPVEAVASVTYTPAAEPTPPAPDPRDAELAALRARIAELESASYIDLSERADPVEEVVGPLETLETDLTDLKARLDAARATPESEDDIAGIYPSWFEGEAQDGESVADRIARLSRKFRSRVNELTNKLLAGEITPEEEAERDNLMDQYNALAELGDRS